MKKQIQTNNEKETKKVRFNLANAIDTISPNQNLVILLEGDLGAGKTKFVEGFLTYFNLEDEISSPTFNIVNEYVNSKVKINHFDVYRLSSYDELLSIGCEEYFDNGINLIEWGNIIEDELVVPFIKIEIKKENENSRLIEFTLNSNDDTEKEKILKEILGKV